jgi:electron transport complex protein RnfB
MELSKEEMEIYRDLQLYLDKFPVGFPPAVSGIELKVLKHLFTKEEALIATKTTWSYESVEKIYERLGNKSISIEQLNKTLKNMAKKGTIKYKLENNKRLYANIPLVVGIYEYQVNKLTKEFVEDFEEYLLSTFGAELLGTKISQYRTIPIEETVDPGYSVANFDKIKHVIENSEHPIAIANCVCRQNKALSDQKCSQTSLKETCFYFGSTGEQFIREGWARQISKDEAIKILEKAKEDGLIMQSGNTENPEFICNCCGCCCAILTNLKKLPRPSRVISCNYIAEINSDLCIGCGTCVERCQINSVKLVDDKAKIILKRCIGCGICVPTCPEQAIHLIKRDKEIIPPNSQEELYRMIMDKKKELRKK